MRSHASLGLVAFIVLAGCGSVEVSGTTTTGVGGSGGQSGVGGASASSSTSTTSTSSTGGAAGCTSNDDCENHPDGPVCDPATGTCGGCPSGWTDCNGIPADGCEWNTLQDGPCHCVPGSTQACYAGAPGTEGVGACKGGAQTCDPSGTTWGPCEGQVLPKAEVCGDGVDDDCNGKVDDVPDVDGDGWTYCNGDCCEQKGACGEDPKSVNPGACEFLGNGIDDDCDPATPDDVPAPACAPAAAFSGVTAAEVAKAMDLCQTASPADPLPTRKWGLLSADYRLPDGSLPSAARLAELQDWQTAVLTAYGSGGVVPKKGPTMAGLSTGRMRDMNAPGYVAPSPGTSFGWSGQPPAAYLAAYGGQLPSSKGCMGACPAGAGAFDQVGVRLTLRVPTNAYAFSYDVRFFTAEYGQALCATKNDFFLALLETQALGIPPGKNVTFDGFGNPVSVNNGFFDHCAAKNDGPKMQCNTCPGGLGALAGTGMEVGGAGAGTKWLTTDAPIVPGETMTLDLMVFDVSDGQGDSLVLLDHFRFHPLNQICDPHPCD